MMVHSADDEGSTQFWNDIHNIKRADRRDRAAQDVELLKRLGVVYSSNDNGVHLMIDDKSRGRVDFWPTTGRWECRSQKKLNRRGISSLLDFLGVEHEPVAAFSEPQSPQPNHVA